MVMVRALFKIKNNWHKGVKENRELTLIASLANFSFLLLLPLSLSFSPSTSLHLFLVILIRVIFTLVISSSSSQPQHRLHCHLFPLCSTHLLGVSFVRSFLPSFHIKRWQWKTWQSETLMRSVLVFFSTLFFSSNETLSSFICFLWLFSSRSRSTPSRHKNRLLSDHSNRLEYFSGENECNSS